MKDQLLNHIAQILAAARQHALRIALALVVAFALAFAVGTGALERTLATATLSQSAAEEIVAEEIVEEQEIETPEMRLAARIGITHEAIDLSQGLVDARKLTPMPLEKLSTVDTETLWLARCLYSETKRIEEMELVAWSIRNRVETAYRGKHSYQDVVLDPWQFSAFNHNSGKRGYFVGLTPSSQADKWQEALTVAHIVKHAPERLRPFSKETRHYYSERSMVGRRAPAWAAGARPVEVERPYQIAAERFRFFENIA